MTITVERNQKIQNLYIYIYICIYIYTHTYTHTHTKQRNIKERRVTIERIVQILKHLKD